MTYLSGKAQKKRKIIRSILFGGVLLLSVFFWPSVREHVYVFVEPALLKYGIVKRSFVVFPEFIKTHTISNKDLVAKNKDLEVTIERLENDLAEKNALLKEFSVGFSSSSTTTEKASGLSRELVLYPIMQDKTKLYSTILLSRGFKDGVEIGNIVYIRGKQAVCVIKEVYTATALCSLLSSANIVTEAVTSSSSISLDLIGRGGSFIANIARDTPVSVGETVFLKSDQSMVLGTIVEVANNNQDTSWHVFIRGAYNPITSSLFYMKK